MDLQTGLFQRGIVVFVASSILAATGYSTSKGLPQAIASEPPVASKVTWLLASPDAFRIDAPPAARSVKTRSEIKKLLELQSRRTPKIRKRVRFWNSVPATQRWTEMALKMVVKHPLRPPIAARGFALLHAAMHDALIAAEDSRRAYWRAPPSKRNKKIRPLLNESGSTYPDRLAAVSGAAELVLPYVFPLEDRQKFVRQAKRASRSRLWAGVSYPSDVKRGRALGRRVAGLALARAAEDGSTNTEPPTPRIEGETYWEPTPPSFEPGIGLAVGTWEPWVMASPGAARIDSGLPPPPTYGSPQFMQELQEVIDVDAALTEQEKGVATFWDDGPRTFTPAGHWNDIALDLVGTYDLDTAETATIFAALNVALADSAIAFFEAKYTWWSIRPITVIRRLCDDGTRLCTVDELEAEPSRATYPTWESYIVTPPFPSYPGGHSTFSGAAGAILTSFFPTAGEQLNLFADEAAMSRLFGGIHFRSDNDAGLVLGRDVAQKVLDRIAGD